MAKTIMKLSVSVSDCV